VQLAERRRQPVAFRVTGDRVAPEGLQRRPKPAPFEARDREALLEAQQSLLTPRRLGDRIPGEHPLASKSQELGTIARFLDDKTMLRIFRGDDAIQAHDDIEVAGRNHLFLVPREQGGMCA